jgi:hypothetical protein
MVDTDLSGWLPITGVQLDRQMVERILTEAESVFQPYLTPDGTVRFASPAHCGRHAKALVTRSRMQRRMVRSMRGVSSRFGRWAGSVLGEGLPEVLAREARSGE